MTSPNPTDNQASIALLRRFRAGGDDVHFVHRIDVCAAPPEALVADLEPVPGTGLEDDGFSRIWYFYHAKKYNNTRGDTSGYRKRAVTGGGGTAWHSETSRKDVQGSGGGTFCKFSYGRKTEPSARSIDRMGWCMTEYDLVAADDSTNYVLCKVYRSPRAKGKSAPASSTSSKQEASSKQTAKKRKAGGGDHPEAPAPPAKLIQQPADLDLNIEDINLYLDENASSKKRKAGGEHLEAPPLKSTIQQQQEPQVQQQTTYCHQPEEVGVQQTAGPGMEHRPGGDNFNIEDFNVDEYTDILEMLRDEPEPEPGQQQPTIAKPEHDGRFIQLPCGPVLAAEVTAEETTTTYGHCSSYAPSWLYTGGIRTAGCSSGLLQHQGSSLHLPYLLC